MKLVYFFIIVSLSLFFIPTSGWSQESIELINPSFEGIPHGGGSLRDGIKGWKDCGRVYFKRETPPDLHNSIPAEVEMDDSDLFFGVKKEASDGRTFLGMVARDNETYEAISQRLQKKLQQDQCYTFNIDLCHSDIYYSPYPVNAKSKSYTKPIVLRIYGGDSYCSKRELLAESDAISNTDWQTFTFEFKPTFDFKYLTLIAYYKTPTLLPYNGNLLLDNAGAIVPVLCPEEEQAIAEAKLKEEQLKEEKIKEEQEKKEEAERIAAAKKEAQENKEKKTVKEEQPVMTINTDFDRKTIKKGQVISIKNLYFEANQSRISDKSYESLNELVAFLKANSGLKIEVGGHTNGLPKHAWCDSLSTLRAEAVASYLFEEGVQKEQVEAKGYGKRNPIASNKTKAGRIKNQRVEIKVLDVD